MISSERHHGTRNLRDQLVVVSKNVALARFLEPEHYKKINPVRSEYTTLRNAIRFLDKCLHAKYLDIKINHMSANKLEPLSGGSGVHVFLVLWKAARAIETYAEKSISGLDMGSSDFAVLEALLHKGSLPVNEIGRKVLLTSGSITVAVDRLETKGLVERRAHGTDRRARIVHLTKEGRKLITQVYAVHAGDMERLAAASLTKAERKTLIGLLKKIGYKASEEASPKD